MHVHTFEYGYSDPPNIPPPATVLDLGANIGLTAALYQHLWPEAKILAVEMDVDNACMARMNGANVLCAAVSAGSAPLRRYRKDVLPASYELDPGGEGVVAMVTILDLVAHMGGRVDFVKMDIEGAEWDVLSTARDWGPYVSALLIERHVGAYEVARAMLESAGYEVAHHPRHSGSLWAIR